MLSQRHLFVLAATISAVVAPANAALAQTKLFNVPAGDLRAALLSLTRQSGLQLIYRTGDLQGARTQGVRGVFTADAALAGLLRGTGLTAYHDASGAVAISRAKAALRPIAYASPPPALAPVPASKPPQIENSGIADIVVTATRKEQLLRNVPISVSVLSAAQIESRRIASPVDLTRFTPNLQQNPSLGSDTPIFALRGVSMFDYSLNQEGPIALYYDEVYKGNVALIGLGLFDVERIEVLRGPQGTLYGKNTTGGAINIISRTPDFSINGYIRAGYGNYNRREADAAFQTKLTDTIAVRVAGTFKRADGWLKNLTPGQHDPEQTRQWGLRGTLLFRPSPQFDLTIRATSTLQNPWNYGVITKPGPLGVGGEVYNSFGLPGYTRDGLKRDQIESDDVKRRRQRTNAVAATARWRPRSDLTLTSITSWDRGIFFNPEDSDGAPVKDLEIDYYGRTTQITQDIRLSSDFNAPFNFTVGAYYNRSRLFNYTDSSFFTDIDVNGDGAVTAADCAATGFVACRYRNQFRQTKVSYAVYGDGSYDLTSHIKLRAGLRYTHDRGRLRDFKSQLIGVDNVILANVIPGDPVDLNATTSRDFKTRNLSGKVGIDFKSDRGDLFYLSYTTGYRGAAFNGQAAFDPAELSVAKPEKLASLEGGVKAQFLDRHLQVSMSAFWYRYRNMQFIVQDPATAAQVLGNLGRARVLGGEMEIIARPTRRLTISGALGMLYSRIESGVLAGQDLRGNQLSNSPHYSLNAAIDWTAAEAEWGKLALSMTGNYLGKQYFDVFNTQEASQGAYGTVNGRLTYTTPDGQSSVSAWVDNISNTHYWTYRTAQNALGFGYLRRSPPRMFGLTAEHKFR